ncbi:alpha/beta fold hydrolase [Sphaerisporangium aureirubrum]|uniref:Alpha/beta fold hydrolase n=1 Tax=Sphaerisporangium aureirubrum TaxID=1544736 RepID=A0ABW1NSC6_9ACTN
MTYVLIHGAASGSWYWHLLAAELRARGHDVVAPDLPCDDDEAGLAEYAATVVDAIGGRTGLTVVAQSFGGFTAPLVCDRVPAGLLVLVNAMIPVPGETPGDWWGNTGWEQARREQDELDGRAPDDDIALFLHDVPRELAEEALKRSRPQSATPFTTPWPLPSWPQVPTRFLLCRDDRFLPAAFLRRLAGERLGITPDEMDGGHTVALSRPRELADRLEAYGPAS